MFADIVIALIAAATFVVAVLIVTIGVIYFKRYVAKSN